MEHVVTHGHIFEVTMISLLITPSRLGVTIHPSSGIVLPQGLIWLMYIRTVHS